MFDHKYQIYQFNGTSSILDATEDKEEAMDILRNSKLEDTQFFIHNVMQHPDYIRDVLSGDKELG